MKILVLHQDTDLVRDMLYSFEYDGDRVVAVTTIAKALQELMKDNYTVCLLGSAFVDGTALDFLRRKIELNQIPTLLLSKDDDVKSIVISLEYGADDYLCYPINMMELKARIRAILRRIDYCEKNVSQEINLDYVLERGEIKVILAKQEVRVNDEIINLTHKEFHLLLYFIQNEDQLLTREQIAENVWSKDTPSNIRTVDVFIRRLRAKLEKYGVAHKIQTKWGKGYIFSRNFILEEKEV